MRMRHLLAVFASFAAAQTAASNGRAHQSDEAETSLGSHVRKLADSGKIDDPGVVSKILGVRFVVEKRFPDRKHHHVRCARSDQALSDGSWGIKYRATGPFWFRKLPEGRIVTIGGDIFTHIHQTENPALDYTVFHYFICYPFDAKPHEEIHAEITFSDVPAYKCITEQALQSSLPKPKSDVPDLPMHGWNIYSIDGKTAGKYGIEVSLNFYSGVDCLISIDVEQDFDSSLQSREARKQRQACEDAEKGNSHRCGAYWDYLPGGRGFQAPARPKENGETPASTGR